MTEGEKAKGTKETEEQRGAAVRRTVKKAEMKNRKLSNRKQGKSGRKKAKAERKERRRKTRKCVPESLKEADERKRKRASRGSQMQGRNGGRKKEIAFEAACI